MTDWNKVQLVRLGGPTSIHIDAEITEEGDLLFVGQDIGAAPSEMFGDDDYEYWLRVPAQQKDRVLLALLEKFLRGNHKLVSEMRAYFESKGIDCHFYAH